jgi:hypothetical protein
MTVAVRHFSVPSLLFVVIIAATLIYAQEQRGAVAGTVLGKDGKTPLVGAVVQIDSLARTTDGRIALLERITTKTRSEGRYSVSDVIAGRIRITIIVDNKPMMSYGGDDILVVSGQTTVADFDLSKADPTSN